MAKSAFIGIDIGGTNTRIASFKSQSESTFDLITRFGTSPDYTVQFDRVIKAVRDYGVEKPLGVGVSVPARLTPDGSAIDVCLHLKQYEGRNLKARLMEAFGCEVAIAHDATCGLLGEHRHGALRGYDRCGYMTLSTGVGAALRLGNESVSITMTNEAGHQLIGHNLKCECGQVGCFEAFAGGRHIEKRLGVPASQITDDKFWREYANYLSITLANFALVARIEAIALGGAILFGQPSIWQYLLEDLDARLKYVPLTPYRAMLGEDAPLVGTIAMLGVSAQQILH
jgi:glucokinase